MSATVMAGKVVSLRVHRSKTDQRGIGQFVKLYRSSEVFLCLLRTLFGWLQFGR